MASPTSDENPSSAQQDSSSTSMPQSKAVQDVLDWADAHRDDPPHREKVERTPGDGQRNHGGPIWVTKKDGVLIGTSKKEYDRLAQLEAAEATEAADAAADENKGEKEAGSSS